MVVDNDEEAQKLSDDELKVLVGRRKSADGG